MKTVKNLFAISLIAAAASSANAAIYTYDLAMNSAITGISTGGASNTVCNPAGDPSCALGVPGPGLATLDTDAGTLKLDFTFVNYISAPTANAGDYKIRAVWSYTGAYNAGANTFATTGGTGVNVSCVPGTQACPGPLNLGVNFNLTATPATGNGGGLLEQVFNVGGGANTATLYGYNHLLKTAYNFNFTPQAPAVPVPAAAWLFGSGLLGLAGAARRRRAA